MEQACYSDVCSVLSVRPRCVHCWVDCVFTVVGENHGLGLSSVVSLHDSHSSHHCASHRSIRQLGDCPSVTLGLHQWSNLRDRPQDRLQWPLCAEWGRSWVKDSGLYNTASASLLRATLWRHTADQYVVYRWDIFWIFHWVHDLVVVCFTCSV